MKKSSIISKVLGLILVTALMVSCGTIKKTVKTKAEVNNPISVTVSEAQTGNYSGSYNWVVTGTPNGDQSGSMSLKKTESAYTGELSAMGTSVPIENITVKGNAMTGYLAVQDMELAFTIVFEGDGFKGNIFASDEGFPFNGKKIK